MINKIVMTIDIGGKDPVAYAVKVNAALLSLDAGPVAKVTVSEAKPVEQVDIPAQLPAQPVADKPKRGRPPKAAAPAPESTLIVPEFPVEEPKPAPKHAAVSATIPADEPVVEMASQQQAQEALAKLFEKCGLETSLNLLTRNGVKRVSDLKPEQRAAFVKEAAEWTANGGEPNAAATV
jgi:hypothetical protein